ncbi:GNAT family N-acetyltransferase [Aliiglaciecola sp. NS0011-25]|uniref:GNAT family N-acetyltransferase n=1 Tax=Aliiglaciecola sp. NS0011-25 TaxID=3127654 RepID=UPI0033412563
MDMEILKTQYQSKRFRFKTLINEDLDLFCELYCNDIVMGKIMPKLTRQQAKSLFLGILKKQQQCANEFWRIECIVSGQSIGIQGFMTDKSQRKHNDAEFGILLSPEFYGKNIATESVTAMLFYGFRHLGLMSAHAYYNADNIAIQKIAHKLNFKIEADNNQANKMRCSISKDDFLKSNEDTNLVIK